jgi:hypothetical protein
MNMKSEAKQSERETISFHLRTASELLNDYVTGRIGQIEMPIFIRLTDSETSRQWGCIPGPNALDDTEFVCSMPDFNRWVLANASEWEQADLAGLMKLGPNLERFLYVCLGNQREEEEVMTIAEFLESEFYYKERLPA